MKIDFSKKQIKSYEDAQKASNSLKKPFKIVLLIFVALFVLWAIFPSLTAFVLPVLLIVLVLLIILWGPSSKISTTVLSLKNLQCEKCKHALSLDDLMGYTSSEAVRKTSTHTSESVKKEFKNESVETLAARKYLGQDVTETKTSSTTTYDFKGYAEFKCPECGEIHKVETKTRLYTFRMPTEAEKEKEVQKYFEKYYFPKLRTFEFK